MQQAVPEDTGGMSGMQDLGGMQQPADVPVVGNELTSL